MDSDVINGDIEKTNLRCPAADLGRAEEDMSKITWTLTTLGIDTLTDYAKNPRSLTDAQFKQLKTSLDKFGMIDKPIINLDETHTVIGGHQRLRVLRHEGVKACECWTPDRELTEREVEELNIRLNANTGAWDVDTLANQFDMGDLKDWGLELPGFDFGQEPEGEDPGAQEENIRVPDAVWPSDNDWGIPLLDINLQATALDLPFETWGASERKRRMLGTWHFYTQDYRYEALWKDPTPIIETGAVNLVEPNFSCYNQMARAFALFQIYRKRWMARYWQSFGIKVFADLNVAEPFYDLNLLGVPAGWKAWATRGYSERIASAEKEYKMAVERAGTSSILFVVYGGGKQVKAACQSNGWLWFDEQENIRHGKE